MENEHSAELSSFIDGELDEHRESSLLTSIKQDAELRKSWNNYHLIGDALRGSSILKVDITDRVMAQLQGEPVVLAPPLLRKNKRPLRTIMALAAAVCGVAVVGWTALNLTTQPTSISTSTTNANTIAMPQPVANSTKLTKSSKPVKNVKAPASDRMQEYLMAHQAYSPSSHIQGGTSYIRTVSATQETTSQ